MSEPNWAEVVSKLYEQGLKDRGNLNIIIAGRSGVGKSTLINAMFQDNLAKTGQGKPVTQEIREYSKEGLPITVFDTCGLEMEQYQSTVDGVVSLITTRAMELELDKHIHLAWVCISEEMRRVEDGEIALVKRLSELGLPVIAVITRARANQGFDRTVRNLLPDARQVVRVYAKPEIDDEGRETKQVGLNTLLEATSEVIPDGVRNALSAAQKVSVSYKVTRSQKYVGIAIAAATAAAATPIAIADAAMLVTIQCAMIVGITVTFGLRASSSFVWSIMSTVIGGGVATLIGRSIVTNLLNLLPGGVVASAVIKSGTAIAVTGALGEMYIGVLRILFSSMSSPTADEVAEAFRKEWHFKKSKTQTNRNQAQ